MERYDSSNPREALRIIIMINLNEQKLSLKTALPLIQEHKNLYKSFVDLGIDSLSKKRIAVSILARNNSDVIQKNLTILIDTLKKLKTIGS